MANGYYGKVLWVNLTTESFEEQQLPEEIYRQYLGGYGLACKLIYENTHSNYDPLSSEAILGFFPGLLTGTTAPFSGRYMVCGKSPLTGCWGEANSGGTFGPAIKGVGYDGILFKGIASKPVYLSLVEGRKEILDASEIWGLDIIEAEEKLKEKHGKFIKTAGIGQAGENLSLIAGVANDKGRLAARSGLGAVMGSKKLKMLVLKGKERVSMTDKSMFTDLTKRYNKTMEKRNKGKLIKSLVKMIPKLSKTFRRLNLSTGNAPNFMFKKMWHIFGTSVNNTYAVETGDAPVKNWAGINKDFPHDSYMKLSANAILDYVEKPYGCFACPVQCGAIVKVPELGDMETHRPEYETCTAFGSNLQNDDLLSIFELGEICNRASIDVISAGATVAFAMDCYEQGILTKKDTDGLELTWGNSEAIVELTKKIIKREGIGDLLADGVKVAAEKIGKGSEKYAIHSLGQEVAMHNPRVFSSLAYSYAFSPTPGKHTTSSIIFADLLGTLGKCIKGFKLPKGYKKSDAKLYRAQMLNNSIYQVVSSLGLCMFMTYFIGYPALEFINSMTDWKMKMYDLIKAGNRIYNLKQAFTLREGIDLANNELNGRVYGDPPFEKGPTKRITVEYKDFYKRVCETQGWDTETAIPFKETLEGLDLDYVVKDFY